MYINQPKPQRVSSGYVADTQRRMPWVRERPPQNQYQSPYPTIHSPQLVLPPSDCGHLQSQARSSTASPSPEPTGAHGIKRAREDSCGSFSVDGSWLPSTGGQGHSNPQQQLQGSDLRPVFSFPSPVPSQPRIFFPPQQGRFVMGSGDPWIFSDGMPETFENRELQNGYLDGVAGSPFSGYPDKSMFARQFSQYHGIHPTFDIWNLDSLVGGGGGSRDVGFPVSFSGNNHDAAFSSTWCDFPMLDTTSSSVFPGSFPVSHGLPVQGNSNFNNIGCDTGSGFGSFSFASGGSPGNETPPLSGSFSSTESSNCNIDDRGNGSRHGKASVEQHARLRLADDGRRVRKRSILPKGVTTGHVEATDSDNVQSSPLFSGVKEKTGDRGHEADEERIALEASSPLPRHSTAPPRQKLRRSLPNNSSHSHKATWREESPELALGRDLGDESDEVPSLAPRLKRPRASRKVLVTPKTAKPKKATPRPAKTASPKARKTEEDQGGHTPVIVSSSSRDERDKFLLSSRRKGMSYREIRAAGRFSEAESTLRGRYRTLTKSKEQRVRKPEWSEKDIYLLRRGVQLLDRRKRADAGVKNLWKSVAEYISKNGGSYLFGNATCRKKWDELVMEEAPDEEKVQQREV